MSKYLILFLVIGTLSCKSKQVKEKNPENMGHSSKVTRSDTLEIVKEESEIEINDKIDTLEQKLIDAGLIDIQNIITDILIDVRYSSTNNFMKQDVYGDLNRIYLQESVANDLLKSRKLTAHCHCWFMMG
jgi:D-alanyl-D-alanine dipeptidase